MFKKGSSSNDSWLDLNKFKKVIMFTPLISIDFLIRNENGEYLLGLRTNRPAQGFWFVPGGRVFKNEPLDVAFKRLTREELGVELERSQADFKGLYEHFYYDSMFSKNISTHYIVLAYEVEVTQKKILLNEQQHSQCKWVKNENFHTLKIHAYTLDYFRRV